MLKNARARAGVSLLLGGLAAAGASAGYPAARQAMIGAASHRFTDSPLRVSQAHLPLAFERNVGQAPVPVQYLARSQGSTLLLDATGATLHLEARSSRSLNRVRREGKPSRRRTAPVAVSQTSTVRMQLLNARPDASIASAEPLPGHVNYLIGRDPAQWKTHVPTFARVSSQDVYPGIDLAYYGNGKQLEYDFVVRPGADPDVIRMELTGAQALQVDARGDLLIRTEAGVLRQQRPVAYQEIDGRRMPVSAAYELNGRKLAFQLGEFDASRPLVIDPLLNYSTYLGGSGDDLGAGIGVDSSGQAYVVGTTFSPNFPTNAAYQPNRRGNQDVFITKLNSAGTSVLYSTYLGGTSDETGQGIAISANGMVTVTGDTASADFPFLAGAQSAFGGITDAFITRLNENGLLAYSTLIGGNDADVGNGVAIDSSGNTYIAGVTSSSTLPGAAPNSLVGASDAFVTKLSASGDSVSYTRFVGGSDFDVASAVDVTAEGEAVVTGFTYSTNFPRVGALQNSLRGPNDAFVTRLNSTGSALQYSTYLGGSGDFDEARAVAVDATGNAYVTGVTYSNDFPVSSGFQSNLGGSGDAFVVKLNPAGNSALFSTYLGGALDDLGNAIRVTADGRVWVGGETSSTNFPTVSAVQTNLGGGMVDGFTTCFNASGQSLNFSTYLGGSGDDVVYGLIVDVVDNLYVTGATGSNNFPTVQAAQPTLAGGVDAFVVRLGGGPGAPLAPSNLQSTATPTQVNLAWVDHSNNEDRFEIERRTGGLPFALLGSTGATTYIDNTVSANTTYVYRVRAVNTIGASAYSNEHTVTVPTTLPAAPTNLVASVVSAARVDLTWSDNSDNEELFQIERKSNDGEFDQIGLIDANSTTYSDTTTLSTGVAYTYRVTAYNAMGGSSPATSEAVTIPMGGKIKVSPKKLAFGTVKLGKYKDKKFTIQNAGKGTLQGTIIAPEAPFLIVAGGGPFTLAPKKKLKVTVRMLSTEADTYQDVLQVLSTDPARPQTTLKLTAKAK